MATGTSPNKRFNEYKNGCERALKIFVDFSASSANDQTLRRLENVNNTG